MKLKKILAAVAAAAVAVSTMAVNTFALSTKDYFKDGVVYINADKPEDPTWAIDAGVDQTTVYGVTFHVTFGSAEWYGGGIGANSPSTGWKSIEWGTNSKEITADVENGTITWLSDAPVFKADDKYAQLWMQIWSGADSMTIDSADVLGEGGTVLSTSDEPAKAEAEAEPAPAVTVELDAAYPGDWSAGKCIAKSDLEAIGGDVKVVLTVEVSNVSDDNSYLFRPMDFDNGWTAVTDKLTAEQAAAKPDGMMQVKKDQTNVEFVIPAATVSTLGNSGLGFQVCNVTIKSAEISAGAPENPLATVEDSDTQAYCNGTFEPEWPKAAPAVEEEKTAEAPAPAPEEDEAEDEDVDVDVEPEEEEEEEPEAEPVAEEPAPAVEEAPAPVADGATTPVKTGNAAVASVIAVMAVAGAAAIVSKKRK